jgi:NAD(P)-dependent dehydrogenase (short-subunit alcohol dehydrogenase family)
LRHNVLFSMVAGFVPAQWARRNAPRRITRYLAANNLANVKEAFPSEVKGMVQRTESELGPIELLVNNAGIAGPMEPLWETDPNEWWRCEEVNVPVPP